MLRKNLGGRHWRTAITATVLLLAGAPALSAQAAAPDPDQAASAIVDDARSSAEPTDFQGVWKPDFVPPLVKAGEGTNGALVTIEGTPLPYNAKSSEIFSHRIKMEQAGTPVANSVSLYLPALPVYQLNLFLGVLGVIQDREHVVVMFEDGSNWQIYLNRDHPAMLTPTYMGDSVGHWEGATLVVDSIGFNTKTWLDSVGSPHTAKLHLVTRIRKIEDGRKLEFLTTYEDPELYLKPFTVRRTATFHPELTMFESEIENLRPENNSSLVYENN